MKVHLSMNLHYIVDFIFTTKNTKVFSKDHKDAFKKIGSHNANLSSL